MAQIRCISPPEIALRDRLRINPQDFGVSIELGRLVLSEGRNWEAVAFAFNATEIRPDDYRGHDLLGTAETEMSPLAGEPYLRRAMALRPDDWTIQCRLASNLKRQGRFAEARELYVSTLIYRKPHKNGLWALREWAEMAEMTKDYGEATTLLSIISRIDPDSHDPLIARARIEHRKRDDWQLDWTRDLHTATNLSPYAMSEKGKLYDLAGRYDEAWECWERGKQMAGYEYQDKAVADLFHELRAFPWDQMEPAATAPGPQPIFITGFMRSGTTLAEQILTSHPAISPGGELQTLPNTMEFLLALHSDGDKPTANFLRDFYLNDARNCCRPEGLWFTDKMPLNEIYAPLIHLMFPKSPIIRMVRHPLDVMVSAFSHHANHGHYCALRLETLALHYKRVDERVSDYGWNYDIPHDGKPYDLPYEDLIEDKESQIGQLFKFVGLSARDALPHTQNTRVPLTPSHEQVKQPLYTTSIGRWQNYRRQLQPAIDILAPTIERLGYTL